MAEPLAVASGEQREPIAVLLSLLEMMSGALPPASDFDTMRDPGAGDILGLLQLTAILKEHSTRHSRRWLT